MSEQMSLQKIIERLDYLGHLRRPFNAEPVRIEKPIEQLATTDQEVREAIRSFQALHRDELETLVQRHHGRKQVYVDGDIGPATLELMLHPVCGAPDFNNQAMAVGQGNWKRCHGIGEYHCAVVAIKTALPAFLAPHWDEVWNRVVESYAEVGLLFVRDDNHARPQITLHFVRPDGGWIGLAIVSNNSTCSSGTIWAKFDNAYRPANIVSEWTSLVKHELGHNCGLDHSRGGVMNPSLVSGLPVSWRNDPSWHLLASRFGGQAVPRNPPGAARKMVLAWQDSAGRMEWISDVPQFEGGGAWPV